MTKKYRSHLLQFVTPFFMSTLWISCGGRQDATPPAWSLLPEDGGAKTSDPLITEETDRLIEENLTEDVDQMLVSTGNALDESGTPPELKTAVASNKTLPWHLEYFMSDLAFSVQGKLGFLLKGASAVTLHWRRQGQTTPLATETLSAFSGATLDPSSALFESQIEPFIQTAILSGKVRKESETVFRENITVAAGNFRKLISGVQQNPGVGWWPSRLRFDFLVDVSGKVLPVLVSGADLRLRFEWFRIMKPVSSGMTPLANEEKANLIKDFIVAMAEDVAEVADSFPNLNGYKAHSFRVGLGMTAKGSVGIAKASTSAVGQIYFSRDVNKPKVRPVPHVETFNLIEEAPSQKHLHYATSNGIAFRRVTPDGAAVYQMNRGRFRKGLVRAARMASFFTRRASRLSVRAWKIYELKTAFDVSMTGAFAFSPVTNLGGFGTTEISFYNERF